MGRPLTPLPGGEGVEPSAYQDMLAADNVMLHLVRGGGQARVWMCVCVGGGGCYSHDYLVW